MIGSWTIVKNEAQWMGPHLASWLPVLDQMVFFDGNSTDGTLEIIKRFKSSHPQGYKIKLVEDKDPKDLKDDYVRVSNECLWAVDTDLAFFLHPDMMCADPGNLRNLGDCISAFTHMESFAGEPGGQLYRIRGRGERWKNVYRLRNPKLGAHYFGHYGAWNEDVYYREITGETHRLEAIEDYPYPIVDSGCKILHFSDVRSYERRLGRMKACLENQKQKNIETLALNHPRVTLKDGGGFAFEKAQYPEIFKTWEESLCSKA